MPNQLLTSFVSDLEDRLKRAAANIGDVHFCLQQADGKECFFERVYAYEFYHQIRCLDPMIATDSVSLIKTGVPVFTCEVPKQGNKTITAEPISSAIPDMLCHIPGTQQNFAWIEIKRLNSSESFLDDFKKLLSACSDANYETGIFWVFGSGSLNCLKSKLEEVSTLPGVAQTHISVFWHDEVGKKPLSIDLNSAIQTTCASTGITIRLPWFLSDPGEIALSSGSSEQVEANELLEFGLRTLIGF